jgi:hypothetical protein
VQQQRLFVRAENGGKVGVGGGVKERIEASRRTALGKAEISIVDKKRQRIEAVGIEHVGVGRSIFSRAEPRGGTALRCSKLDIVLGQRLGISAERVE